MKRFFKIVGWLFISVIIIAGVFVAYLYFSGYPAYPIPKIKLHVEVTPERIERGQLISNMSCKGCHFDYSTGKLTGKKLLDMPKEFGTAYSKNITQDTTYGIGKWTDTELAVLLRTGINRHGIYTPPWMVKLPRMADEDIYSIIAYLRSNNPEVQPAQVKNRESEPSLLGKFLIKFLFKPFDYPKKEIVAPDPNKDLIAYGKYLVQDFNDCYGCHSADFKSVDELIPEKSEGYFGGGNALLGIDGKIINSANLTPDVKTGIGSWSEQDFIHTLRDGIRPDGRILRYPMTRLPEFTELDAKAIYMYLKTIPPISNPVNRNFEKIEANALVDGPSIFKRYGCVACHHEDGSGLGNITLANKDFPEDTKLQQWIETPSVIRPETKMPSFKGVIKQEEFAPLIAYLRKLGK